MAQNIRDRNSELRLGLQALAFLDEYRKRQAMLDTDMLSIWREISPSLPYMSYNDIKDKYKRLEEILHNASNKLIEDFVINKLIEDFIDVSPDKLFHPSEKEFIGPLLLFSNTPKYINLVQYLKLLSNTTKCINLVQYHHLYSGYISEEDKKTIELFEGLNRGTYLSKEQYTKSVPFLNKIISQNAEIEAILGCFALVTLKYSYFVSDLLNPLDAEIVFEENYLDKIPYPALTVSPQVHYGNASVGISLEKAKGHRVYRSISQYEDSEKIPKVITYNFLSKYRKSVIGGNFKQTGIKGRLIGLWLWDNCKSPLKGNKDSIKEAIQNLVKQLGKEDDYDEATYYKYIDNASACIKEGKIIPMP